jgi:Na+/proline symporter
MNPLVVLACVLGYCGALLLVAWLPQRTRGKAGSSLQGFALAGRNVPWYVVAYGMIGSSISGVTFLSVPGDVHEKGLSYLQIVLGYLVGYALIAGVLLPLYYKRQLTSIYQYLGERLGPLSYQTGAWFFLLSRTLGSAARLYLVALVLQVALADALGVPFGLTVAAILGFILLYTARSGMQSLVWTDVFQTSFMIGAAALAAIIIAQEVGVTGLSELVNSSPYGQAFRFSDVTDAHYFWKDFLGGALIAVVMTGLDQDMMQKNLTVRTLGGSKRNMLSYGAALVLVNALFLLLGLLLYRYAEARQIELPTKSDLVFSTLALQHLGPVVAILFVLGLTAAACNAADGSLTALTTSTCVDILRLPPNDTTAQGLRLRKRVQWAVTGVFFGTMMLFRWSEHWGLGEVSIISVVLRLATYTYGPLLGLFAFGILTQRRVRDGLTPLVCLTAPLVCLLLQLNAPDWFGYSFGIELLLLNGALVFGGLWAFSIANKSRISTRQ